MADDPKTLALSRPIKIGSAMVSALTVDPDFKAGWLRGAPTTPTWMIAVIRSVLTNLPTDAAKTEQIDPAALLAKVPTPTGAEVSEMVPWLLHMAGKATGQPDDVVDQLGVVDLLAILMRLMPGMGALPNFQQTPGSGSGTSPGSSTGAPTRSTA